MSSFQQIAPLYQVLGLTRTASIEELKDRHKQLMRKWHPDKFPAGNPMRIEAEERAKAINSAFQIIIRTHSSFSAWTPDQELAKITPKVATRNTTKKQRRRAMTVERTVIVKDNVSYTIKKMQKIDRSILQIISNSLIRLASIVKPVNAKATLRS
jgi:DnaJ domain